MFINNSIKTFVNLKVNVPTLNQKNNQTISYNLQMITPLTGTRR